MFCIEDGNQLIWIHLSTLVFATRLLVGVDARKALDSVDHEYLLKVLEAYGFGPKFKNWVKLLKKSLKADILVNGYRKDKIDIEQSMKQGDALT